MSVYQVTARRWVHDWELRMGCDYLALDLRGEPEYYDVTITPELDGDLATETEAARQAAAARYLKESGLSGADIAAVLTVSTNPKVDVGRTGSETWRDQ